MEKTQNTFEDCLTRVPLIIKPPAYIPVQPGIRDDLVELIDFTATAYEYAGNQAGLRPLRALAHALVDRRDG